MLRIAGTHRVLAVAAAIIAGLGVARAQEPGTPEALIERLASEDAKTREDAIAALAKDGNAVDRLSRELLGGRDDCIRAGVIEVLGRMGKRGAAAFGEVLEKADFIAAGSVLHAVGEVGPAAAWTVPSLLKLLDRVQSDGKPSARGGKSSGTPGGSMIRSIAILAIGRVAPAYGKPLTALKKLIDASDPIERMCAACALWWMTGDKELAYPVLRSGLDLLPDDLIAKERAIYGLGEMGPAAAEALDALEASKKGALEQTRNAIDSAIAKIRGETNPDAAARRPGR